MHAPINLMLSPVTAREQLSHRTGGPRRSDDVPWRDRADACAPYHQLKEGERPEGSRLTSQEGAVGETPRGKVLTPFQEVLDS
jgi:hypothetical protein